MKTYKEILADLIKLFIDRQDKVTYFGKDSVIRAIFSSVAAVLSQLWNDLYQTKRKIFLDTCEGTDLDDYADRRGMSRKTATKSSVVLVFRGEEGTVIPINTQVRNKNTGVIYQTLTEITITGYSSAYETEYSNVVIAESINTGSSTKSKANELTVLLNPISGLTSVTNFYSSTGGEDSESDSEFRERIRDRINVLAQGTKAYYETIAKENQGIVAKAVHNPLIMGVDVYVLKNNLALYTEGELNSIKTQMEEGQRAMYPVIVYNANQKIVNIYCKYIRDITYTSEEVINEVNISLSTLIDPRTIGFGYTLKYSDVMKTILNTKGVKEVVIDSLTLNNVKDDVKCGSFEIPRISSLTLLDQYAEIVQEEVQYYYTE